MADESQSQVGQGADTPVREMVTSMAAAARVLKVTARTLRNWKGEGCPGFEPDGRVDVAAVRVWTEKKLEDRRGTVDAREEKLLEEIRRLRLANDQKEGRLVERAWVASKIQLAAAEWNTARMKCEAEMPVAMAAAGDDVAQQRALLKEKITDPIAAILQALGKHFEEEPKS